MFSGVAGTTAESPLPALLLIHGDSYSWGAGNSFDGTALAAHGRLIVVSINFRLGVLGKLRQYLFIETDYINNFLLSLGTSVRYYALQTDICGYFIRSRFANKTKRTHTHTSVSLKRIDAVPSENEIFLLIFIYKNLTSK